MNNYKRYFKIGQSLLLKVGSHHERDNRTELLNVHVISVTGDVLVVSLPYGEDAVRQYPFSRELSFLITTDVLGMGLKISAEFVEIISSASFALKLKPGMEIFQRRISPRFDGRLGIRFSRAAKTLKTMREIWERNIEVLRSHEKPLILDGFKKTRVNISSGGIRLFIKPPVNQGELCLVLIDLEDGVPPVCAIAEIIWSCSEEEKAICAGMRFINILSADQQRIDDFVNSKSREKPRES